MEARRISPDDLTIPLIKGDAEKLRQEMRLLRHMSRKELEPLPLKLPVDWNKDHFSDRNWRFQLHAWYMLRPQLSLYRSTRDESYLVQMLPVVKDWANYHERHRTAFSWYDMAVGRRAEFLGLLISVLGEDGVSKSTRQLLLALRRSHMEHLLDERHLATTNHAYIQLHGLMALSVATHDALSTSARNYAQKQLARLLAEHFTPEGIHKEHSPEYHFFVLGILGKMLKTGFYDGFEESTNLLEKAQQAGYWLRTPDDRNVPVGDTGYGACRERRTDDGKPTLKTFDAGYAVVKGGPSLLFVNASYHSRVHKHADDLGLVWHEGRDILIDPGKYSYNKGPWRDYFTSPRAHNTVEIDESSELPSEVYGSGLHHAESFGEVFAVTGTVRRAGVEHCRRIFYRPREWLVVVDRLSSNSPHSYTQWFHFAADLELREGAVAVGDKILTIDHRSNADWQTVTARGVETPRILGWCSDGYHKKVPSPQLGVTARGSTVTLVTRLAFSEAPEVEVSNNGAVRLLVDGPSRSVARDAMR